MSDNQTTDFHARLVERQVNELLGGDATIRELVELMVQMGWTPPAVAQGVKDPDLVLNAEDANG